MIEHKLPQLETELQYMQRKYPNPPINTIYSFDDRSTVYTKESVKARDKTIVQKLKDIKKQSHAAENVIFDCPDQCIRQLTAQQETIKKLIDDLERGE